MGLFFVGIGSCGNGAEDRRCCGPVIGILVVLSAFAMIRLLGFEPHFEELDDGTVVEEDPDSAEKYTAVLGMAFILIVILLHILNMIVMCCKPGTINRIPGANLALGVALKADVRDLKEGAQYKITQMAENALRMSREDSDKLGVLSTYFGRGLHNFAASREVESIGGLVWSWRHIVTGDAARKHGIWYYDRLIASNITQYIICLFVLLFGLNLLDRADEGYDPENAAVKVSYITDQMVNLAVHAEVTGALLSQITRSISKFLGNFTLNGISLTNICSISYFELVEGAVVWTYNSSQPLTQFDYVCAFIEVSNNVTLAAVGGADTQFELLAGAGFDIHGVQGKIVETVNSSAKTAINSLYPAEKYM